MGALWEAQDLESAKGPRGAALDQHGGIDSLEIFDDSQAPTKAALAELHLDLTDWELR